MPDSDELQSNIEKVLNCEVQDASGLNDFQKSTDLTMILIDKVGIERFYIPITLLHPNGKVMGHNAETSLSIELRGGKTGVNMSRFCSILQEEVGKTHLDTNLIRQVLKRLHQELRDYEHEGPIEKSFLDIKFLYPAQQSALVSKNWGWKYYEIEYNALSIQKNDPKATNKIEISLQIKYEYSSVCPCSLSLSKQYEQDYQKGKTQNGHGIAAAHGQRSVATVRVDLPGENHKNKVDELGIDNLIQLLRKALPTEVQTLVKRTDEQAFAILNGNNPMFVEDAARRISQVLNDDQRIKSWKAKIEHFESLHGHNAVATIHSQRPLS